MPEVQGLRALAVLLVVVYHLWPNWLPGGYVGVDVFFVISGFLITSHLHREISRTGRISLAVFYARRARRLLPAAGLVMLVAAAATLIWLPSTRWASTAGELLASAFYVENWVLAAGTVDYSALGDAASPVQHYWSLSVEEQFYLVWPALILLFLALGRHLPRIDRDRLLLAGILAVSGLSFAYSVYATATSPTEAYFVTPTRIWELGLGAALALWLQVRRANSTVHRERPGVIRPTVQRWGGFGAVAAAAVLLNSSSPFPGYLALLPVLGTLAVIAAAGDAPGDPLWSLLQLRPVQFLGDISYGLYLWHWPAIVMAPFVIGRDLVTVDRIALLGGSILAAWLTKIAVEAPAQRWHLLARPLPAAAGAALVMLLVSGAATLQWHLVDAGEDAAQAQLAVAQDEDCFGAAAMAAGPAVCPDVFAAPGSVTLPPGDEPWFIDPACEAVETPVRATSCRFGSGPPTARVALVGDSHAEHWRGALHDIAAARNWELIEIVRGGCPVLPARILSFNGSPVDTEGCYAWGQTVRERLSTEQFDYIFTSSWATAFAYDELAPERSLEAGVEGFAATWRDWADADTEVIVLRDVPTSGGRNAPECLLAHPDRPLECATPRAEAVQPDAMTLAVERVGSDRVRLVDMTDFFCSAATCHAVVGGALVYFDYNHITAQFSRSLAPFLLEKLAPPPS